MPETHVALLRGINVGGKNRLRMEDLLGVFEEVGCTEVRTYIQSGNVVFEADKALARRVAAEVASHLYAEHGLEVPVVLRTAAELATVLEDNPYLASGADEAYLHVAFLATRPAQSRIAKLDPDRSPPDVFQVVGREIYLHCPKGVARSKLTNAWFDSALGTVSTMRSWKTVLKLVELSAT
ncbi:MAG: DUF1697 domain-containing protein [Planctomycetota bacterium]